MSEVAIIKTVARLQYESARASSRHCPVSVGAERIVQDAPRYAAQRNKPLINVRLQQLLDAGFELVSQHCSLLTPASYYYPKYGSNRKHFTKSSTSTVPTNSSRTR